MVAVTIISFNLIYGLIVDHLGLYLEFINRPDGNYKSEIMYVRLLQLIIVLCTICILKVPLQLAPNQQNCGNNTLGKTIVKQKQNT